SPPARLHADTRRPEGARQVAARANERAPADSRHRPAEALLRREAEPRRARRARARPGGRTPGAARCLRGEGTGDRRAAEPCRDAARRPPLRAAVRRFLARRRRTSYSTVTR